MKKLKFITFFTVIVFVVSLWFTVFAACGTVTPKDYLCFYHHRNSIDSSLYGIYDQLENAMLNNKKHTVIVGNYTVEETQEAINAAFYDHPEVMNHDIANSSYLTNLGYIKIVTLLYADDMLDIAYDAIDELVEELEEYDDVNRIGLLYEKLTSSITYSNEADNCYNVYGALIDNRAMCVGIAKAFSCVVTKMGYDNYMVYTEKYINAGHIWNRVNVNGTWYEFDATFDLGKPRNEWKYFGVDYAHPECTDTKPVD